MVDKTAEGQNKILHQVALFKHELNCDPDFNFCIFIYLSTNLISLIAADCEFKKETPFLGLEDFKREDVTFEEPPFFCPQQKAQQFWDATG